MHMKYTNNNGPVPLNADQKWTGYLKDIFMDAGSVECNRVFNTYVTGKQMKMLHNDSQEDSAYNTPTQQRQGTVSGTDISDSKLDCFTKSDAYQNMIMRRSQEYMNGEIRARSGWVICRLERLAIDI